MWEYKKQPVTKQQLLKLNGIFTIDRDEKHFIQHNDYFEHTTFFQCPKCKSFNIQSERAYADDVTICICRNCEDCGYTHTIDSTMEDE